MIQYDQNGLSIQTLLEILAEREVNIQTFLGNDFLISGESVVASLQASDADRELDLQELLLFIANQLDADQAVGIWLDYICALNNITRYKAEKTTVPLIVTGTVGTVKNAGEITIVDENTDEYYINKNAFQIGSDGTVATTFEATSFGKIDALSSSTYSLKTPSIGIDSLAYDTSRTTVIGRDTETDEELRERRADSVTYTASSILSSIKASVSQVKNVTYLNAYENDTMSTVDTLPAKSFEIVVQGGDEDEIAQAILKKKPAGIQAYGTTIKTVEDGDGNQFTVGFTRPTDIPISFSIAFSSSITQTDEWKTNLKNELIDAFTKLYSVGDDVYAFNLYYILNNHPEIVNVTQLQVQKSSEIGQLGDSVIIGKRELATLVAGDITLTQTT